jgi:hypothetical protein
MKGITNQSEFNNSREFVIANFCALEMYINLLISKYFFGKPNYEFTAVVLENQYVNFAFRVSLLEHTIKDKKSFGPVKNMLMRLATLRNLYAHTLPNEVEKDGKFLYFFKSPKGPASEALNAEVVADEFYNLFKELEAYLQQRIKDTKAATGFVSKDALKFDLGTSYSEIFE